MTITTSYWCNPIGKWFSRVAWKTRTADSQITAGPFDTRDEALAEMNRNRDAIRYLLAPWWRRLLDFLWQCIVGA